MAVGATEQQEMVGSPEGPSLSDGPFQLQQTLRERQHRLQQLMQVNRKLHAAVGEKKSRTEELRKKNDDLEKKLQAREAEETGRARQLQDLQSTLQGDKSLWKLEAHELQKQATVTSERIEALNEENMALSEFHRDYKTKVADQEHSMKMLMHRSQELVRLIEFMANHLNEAQEKLLSGQEGSLAVEYGRSPRSAPGKQIRRWKKVDFTRLRGLDLQKLLGEDARMDSLVLSGGKHRTPQSSRPGSSRHSSRPGSRHGTRKSHKGDAGGSGREKTSSPQPDRPESRQSNLSRSSSRASSSKQRQSSSNDPIAGASGAEASQEVPADSLVAAPDELGKEL